MATQVLNYHDVQLYDSDVALFATSQWLNDNAINFYLQYLYHTLCAVSGSSTQRDVLLMDPAVVSCMMLQCDDDDEFEELGRGLHIRSKQLCFIPVNDNEGFGGESSHWSLLVYRRGAAVRSFEHFDSSSGHNTRAAKRIMATFEKMLHACAVAGGDAAVAPEARFVNVRDAPQQRNGYDCGMYVLVVAEYLCRQHLLQQQQHEGKARGAALPTMREYVTPERVTTTRLEMPALVRRLQLEQDASGK